MPHARGGPQWRVLGIVSLILLCCGAPAAATPIVDYFSTGPAKWKSAITVYIPLDPARNEKDDDNKRTRHIQVKEAVEEWKKVAADQKTGLTINAVILDENGKIPGSDKKPDSKVAGTVIVEWDESSTQPGHATPLVSGVETGKTVKNPTTKEDEPLLKDQEYISSLIKLGKGVTVGREQDNKKVRAIMLHEMGHALGIDHSKKKDSVLRDNLDQYIDKTKPGASDARELASTYAAAPARIEGRVTPEGDGFRYAYEVEWREGGELALAQVVLFGAPLSDIHVPDGWAVADQTLPSILSVRVSPTDDLSAYLNEFNPLLMFDFLSPHGPVESLAWAGETQAVIGPAIAEPLVIGLFCAGLGFMVLCRAGRRRPFMTG